MRNQFPLSWRRRLAQDGAFSVYDQGRRSDVWHFNPDGKLLQNYEPLPGELTVPDDWDEAQKIADCGPGRARL